MDNARKVRNQAELTALMICPDRELSAQFQATLPATRVFHILAELKTYPTQQALDIRLRQLRPTLVFVDLATDLEQATTLVEFVAAAQPPVFVVGLHWQNSPEAILRSLRAGATEFMFVPFDIDMQREAIGRITRLKRPTANVEVSRGALVGFTSSKPGSGASTLAAQTAFAIRRLTSKRVLLADFDVWGGTVGFFFKVSHWYSLEDALQQMRTGDVDWASLVVNHDGVDILPAPDVPAGAPLESHGLHDLVEYARTMYDYTVVDLPSVFDKLTLLTLPETDFAYVVTTAELPSLHLTRKAVAYLGKLGIGQARYQVLVNRMGKQEGVTTQDMGKIFGAPVHKTFPNDYLALHKRLTVGQPLAAKTTLGKLIEDFAQQLSGQAIPSAAKN